MRKRPQNDDSHAHFFFRSRGSACAPLSVQQSAADDGRDAPASRPSRPSMAAALARRLGRVGRRLRSKLHGTDRQQPRGAHAKRQTSQKRAGGGDEGDGDWPADGVPRVPGSIRNSNAAPRCALEHTQEQHECACGMIHEADESHTLNGGGDGGEERVAAKIWPQLAAEHSLVLTSCAEAAADLVSSATCCR